MQCPFCERIRTPEVVPSVRNRRRFFNQPRHKLIVTRRHIADFSSLTPEEQTAMWQMVRGVRRRRDCEYHKDAYNVGINIGDVEESGDHPRAITGHGFYEQLTPAHSFDSIVT